MRTIGDIEKPLSSHSGLEPRTRSFLLRGQGEPPGEPQIGLWLAGTQNSGLPSKLESGLLC